MKSSEKVYIHLQSEPDEQHYFSAIGGNRSDQSVIRIDKFFKKQAKRKEENDRLYCTEKSTDKN